MMAPLPAEAHILVVAVARIGDTLLATPLLAAIKKALPACRLAVWAHPKRREALENLAVVDDLAGMTKHRTWLQGRFPAKLYDAALVLGHEPSLLAAATRLARRVAAFSPKATDPVEEPRSGHAVDHRLALLAPFGIPAASRRLLWQITPEESAWAERWLDRQLAGWRGGPLLGLQAASFPTKAYRDWPAGHFRMLLDRFLESHPTGRAVLFGDAAGRERAQGIAKDFAGRTAILAGEASLRQTAAVMARSAAYVGVDTGPSHIAGAVGLPMVVLYHPLHPGANLKPLDHPAALEVIEHPALASGDAAAIASASMADIPADTVWPALQRVLR